MLPIIAAALPMVMKFLTAKAVSQGLGGGSQAPTAAAPVTPPALTGIMPAATTVPPMASSGWQNGLLKGLGL